MRSSALSVLLSVSECRDPDPQNSLLTILVWFIYPETANVRLEDMNSIFGDATSQMPTPATLAEAESLFSGRGSPIPSLDIRRQQSITADSAIPGLDINPPSPANRPMQ